MTIAGQDFYLGPHGTRASLAEYDRIISEWTASGRELPAGHPAAEGITVVELIRRYREFAEGYYVKRGRMTSELFSIRAAIKPLRELYGPKPALSLGPLELKAVRNRYLEKNWARKTINAHIHRIRRMVRWATEEGLLPPVVLQRLLAVSALRKGKSTARETELIGPVSDSAIEATLTHLSAVVRDMVLFQRLTGCRPSEVCLLRPADVDRSNDVWAYVPKEHKTQHLDRVRTVYIGPKAQVVLQPYLLRDAADFCFSPVESVRQHREARHRARKTPLHRGNTIGTNRKRHPRRRPRSSFTPDSYRRAIHRVLP